MQNSVCNYLSSRSQMILGKGLELVSKGVPQRSILGPLYSSQSRVLSWSICMYISHSVHLIYKVYYVFLRHTAYFLILTGHLKVFGKLRQ